MIVVAKCLNLFSQVLKNRGEARDSSQSKFANRAGFSHPPKERANNVSWLENGSGFNPVEETQLA